MIFILKKFNKREILKDRIYCKLNVRGWWGGRKSAQIIKLITSLNDFNCIILIIMMQLLLIFGAIDGTLYLDYYLKERQNENL